MHDWLVGWLYVGLIVLKLLSGNAPTSCHSRQRPPDFHKVKTFMQAKQKQSKSERKNQAAAVESEKAKVKERLLALDAFRRNQNPSQNEVYNYLIFHLSISIAKKVEAL